MTSVFPRPLAVASLTRAQSTCAVSACAAKAADGALHLRVSTYRRSVSTLPRNTLCAQPVMGRVAVLANAIAIDLEPAGIRRQKVAAEIIALAAQGSGPSSWA